MGQNSIRRIADLYPVAIPGSLVPPNADGIKPNHGTTLKQNLHNDLASSLDIFSSIKHALKWFHLEMAVLRECEKMRHERGCGYEPGE